MASLSVGWAWMVNISSSTVPSSSMTAMASAMSSVACGADDVDAENFAVFGVGDDFTKPSWLSTMVALELPAKGNLPILTSWPFSLACASVRPAEPICGSL